jgi:hypothetical protein
MSSCFVLHIHIHQQKEHACLYVSKTKEKKRREDMYTYYES